MKFDYAIWILEREQRELCNPEMVSVYPLLTENGKKVFKRTFKKQSNQIKTAIKILQKEGEK